MNDPLYTQSEFRTTNEPKVHPLIRKSFVFVPSAGMRLAPEILLLELMREIFFTRRYGESTGSRNLDPDETDDERRYRFSIEERSVLHALRGRRKKSKNSITQRFFAPAYPSLAGSGWLGKSRERVICNFLLSGPVSQHFWGKGADTEKGKKAQTEFAECLQKALLGKKSCINEQLESKELLAVALGPEAFIIDPELPLNKIKELTGYSDTVFRANQDELAKRISEDLLSICHIEGTIPRMQWIYLLMTFLRFALPMWLLAQMQITKNLHGWLLEAIDRNLTVDNTEIMRKIASRNHSLLHPTLTATRELFEQIESYIKCRIEINILMYCLEQVRPQHIKGKKLTHDGAGSDSLSLEQLITVARDASASIKESKRFKDVAKGLNAKIFLTREGEQFSAWRNPLLKGQGKNIDEFYRVLYKAELGDEEGGYLLTPEGRGATRGFRVFPGQLLLKTITFLAARSNWAYHSKGGAGKLVLQDVEELFTQYGIDFSTAADARPLLMYQLQAMGLLTGSPDAGSSVEVACPY